MQTPKFKVGQTVRLLVDGIGRATSGHYQVVRLRPFSDGEYHYLIKNSNETHERAVRESQLAR